MSRNKIISPEVKQQAVLSVLRKEEPLARVARRVGVSEVTLSRWRDAFLSAGSAALAVSSKGKRESRSKIESLEKEVASRDQVIGELTIANRILKKVSDGLI